MLVIQIALGIVLGAILILVLPLPSMASKLKAYCRSVIAWFRQYWWIAVLVTIYLIVWIAKNQK